MAKKNKGKLKIKKAKKRKIQKGMAMIQATFNNTLVTLTDEEGNVLIQSSPAVVGFDGARRSTAFAATKAAQDAAQKAITKYGLKEVKVFIKGPGSGRNAAVKGLDAAGLRITQLADRTPLPHNGCMPRKAPRN
jgi:small subunit ribosomal protein S11